MSPQILATIHNSGRIPYGYIPTKFVAILFVCLFGVSTIIHTAQMGYRKMWWLLPTICLCGALEVLGWSARLWSSFSPTMDIPFKLQIVATIVGPTPLLAANFLIFGKVIQCLGPAYSRISAKWYAILFCTCDVIALVIQGVGGGLAATADGVKQSPRMGGNIMLGGIAFQLAAMTVYAVMCIEYFTRYLVDRPVKSAQPKLGSLDSLSRSNTPSASRGILDRRVKFMLIGLTFNTFCLFVRAVYRTLELSNGWTGVIIHTQVYFNVFDGTMVVLALYTMNLAHPGWLLNDAATATDVRKEVKA